jgi:DNA-binding NtrC family response regulator
MERNWLDATSSRPRIVIIDDERGILETVEILLRGEGFDPIGVQSPREALQRLNELEPTKRASPR